MFFTSQARAIRTKGRALAPYIILLYFGIIFLFVRHNFSENTTAEDDAATVNESRNARYESKKEIVFFLILCKGRPHADQGGKQASSFSRQLRQTAVMLKSAAALTASTLRFIVIADSKPLYQQIAQITSPWPEEYKKRIVFEYHDVWYPANRQEMRSMFRVCATERLFLPDMFPSLDAAIYIDTDLIFMRPPEELWEEFDKFDDLQVAAMAPCLYHYGSNKNKVPYFGKSGLNAGIMHMNITRMKNFPEGGWIPANMKVFDNFKNKIKLADQDILNILFNKYPELLYELGCEWNYRIWQCSQGRNLCDSAATNGVSILHGNAMAFVNGAEMKLQVVFEEWERHQLGMPLDMLMKKLQERLVYVSKTGQSSKCARISGIDTILTKELQKHV